MISRSGRLASRLLLALGRRRAARIWRRLKRVRAVQERLLRRLLSAGCQTHWGRERGYDRIASLADYQATQPLTRHPDVLDYWNRAMAGEPDVVWPGTTRYFGMSSGTTSAAGHNKYVPLTPAALHTNRRGGFDALAFYLAMSGDDSLLRGKLLFLGGSTTLDPVPSRYRPQAPGYVGDNTGIMAKHLPRALRRFTLPTPDLTFIASWEEKVARIAVQAAAHDVRLVAGVPSWMAILFQRLLEHTGCATVREVWPNLRVFIHGGMAYAPFAGHLEALVGAPLDTIDTYTATEGGLIATQDRLAQAFAPGESPDMLVVPDLGAFFEFVRLDDADLPHPPAATLSEVEPGVPYVVVMTTNAGLWRYVVGDTVVFTSAHPPRLRFAGRLAAFLNFFGEHVIQEELERAVVVAAHATHTVVVEFAVAPVFPSPEHVTPGHRWYVEFAGLPPQVSASFAGALDAELVHVNADYAAHRVGDAGLVAPELVVCPPGTFYAFMKARGQLGGQHKVPKVLGTPALVQALDAARDAVRRVVHIDERESHGPAPLRSRL